MLNEIKNMNKAIQNLYEKDNYVIDNDVNKSSIIDKLAMYM